MPDPVCLISAFSTPEVDNIIKELEPKKLHVYIDLKNVMRALFIEDVVKEMIHNSNMMGKVDSSIFQSVINICSYWKRYAFKRGLEANIYICSDIGESTYHTTIDKNYKKSRKITSTTSEICGDKIKYIRDRNFIICEKICNKLPNIYFLCLKFLESDFLPYYLINRKFDDDDTLHIVFSNDKDLYQCVTKPNIVQIYKSKGDYVVLRDSTMLSAFVRFQDSNIKTQIKGNMSSLDPNHVVSIMALCGDAGDDVPGLHGVGRKTAAKTICQKETSDKIIGTPESVWDRIMAGGKFLEENYDGLLNKTWKKAIDNNDLVTRAYKLISFEILCRWLEKGDTLSKREIIKYMDKLLDKDGIQQVPSLKSFVAALDNIEDFNLSRRAVEDIFIGD